MVEDSEDFEALLEESFEDPRIMGALNEKLTATGEGHRMSVAELVKGYPAVQRELDLHGHTADEAMFELTNFITQAILHRIRTVRVVTGKGLHSKHMKSVLPQKTEQKLAQLKRGKKVLSFCRERTGGSYVVYLIA